MSDSGYGFSRGTVILKKLKALWCFTWIVLRGYSQHFLRRAFFCLSFNIFFFRRVIYSLRIPLNSVCQGLLWYNLPVYNSSDQFFRLYFMLIIWVWILYSQRKLNSRSKTLLSALMRLWCDCVWCVLLGPAVINSRIIDLWWELVFLFSSFCLKWNCSSSLICQEYYSCCRCHWNAWQWS